NIPEALPEPELAPIYQHIPVKEEEPPTFAYEESPTIDIDWKNVGLGLLALILAGGLIPFWMWIYYVYNPPIR
ncbi:MAG: hypothetical protein HOG15_10110, partial [Anaerolineae bacterium]|nr:hypothetical protein [Anaerolineae bacterium]